MERPPSLNTFRELFSEDYDTEQELIRDWEGELNEFRLYVQAMERMGRDEDSTV